MSRLHVIDAEWLSSILGRGHKVAKADRKIWWCHIPMEEISEPKVQEVMKVKHKVAEDLWPKECMDELYPNM